MALPWLFRKLFQNDGAGEKLNPGVIPTTVNGVAADASGNIAIKDTNIPNGPFLPLSGGSIKGAIRFGNGGGGTCDVGAVADYPRTTARAFGYDFFCNGVRLGQVGVLLGDPGSDYYYQKAQRFYFGPSYNDPMSLQIEPSTGSIIHREQWLRYVVAAEYNGNQWYRKYNDGWIEQGGLSAYWQNGSASGYTTITLNTPHSGTNYQVSLTPVVKYGSSGGDGQLYHEDGTRTTTNFRIRKMNIDGMYVYWRTSGL